MFLCCWPELTDILNVTVRIVFMSKTTAGCNSERICFVVSNLSQTSHSGVLVMDKNVLKQPTHSHTVQKIRSSAPSTREASIPEAVLVKDYCN